MFWSSNQTNFKRISLVEKFGLVTSKTFKTSMSTTIKLIKHEEGENVDVSTHQSMIGSFLYFTTSRPDLCQCWDLRTISSLPKEISSHHGQTYHQIRQRNF